ncbi:MAG: acyl-CoA dehydrogenase family protein [Deltaproteobacteria bacterium]|nr:acyl-CoA dehydrogenase family protein [Deltaproteobacteria bacterium]
MRSFPLWKRGRRRRSFRASSTAKAGAAGFLGLGFPEEYGGTPGDVFHGIAYSEELCRGGSMGLVAGAR